jgi:FlaA1/EpsC-like NDP-sugar epimerase
MRPPPAELLLGRAEFAGDLGAAAEWVAGRRVLVTGAAGSVGTPLSNLLAGAHPARLVLLDHHEYSLFALERALGASSATYELADIGDSRRMARIFEEHRPEIVFHLAAAKHVPYGERFPEGAVASNVLATADLLRLARETTVERFVYPSSDKSVDPPALYGATKRLAEALVQTYAGDRAWSIVRYVNIIGTRGSVIEVFANQILADRPLSVTDERMTRYWISMDEALWSLLHTARRAQSGSVLMPDCGEPVPLMETARRLAGWYRPESVPYPIANSGIRPGERLHEVLLSHNETFAEGPAAGLRLVQTRRPVSCLDGLGDAVDALREMVARGQRDELKQRCLALAERLQ